MTDGLLFVLSEPGVVPEVEFHDWYDNEHAPARLTVPGIRGGVRYRAADGQVPTWLAYYELALEALSGPEYAAVAVRSPREQRVVAGLATLDRRVYEQVDDAGEVRGEPAPLVVCVGPCTRWTTRPCSTLPPTGPRRAHREGNTCRPR